MFSFVKRLIRHVKQPFKKTQSSNDSHPTEFPQPRPPPPSYNDVIEERQLEIKQLSNEVMALEKKKEDSLHKYMFAESRYMNCVSELEQMQQDRVRAVLEGRRKANDRGFKISTQILKEEITFLEARRCRLRSDLVFDICRFHKAQHNLISLRRRFRKDTGGFRQTTHPRCCSRSQFCCYAIDASFRRTSRNRYYATKSQSIYVG